MNRGRFLAALLTAVFGARWFGGEAETINQSINLKISAVDAKSFRDHIGRHWHVDPKNGKDGADGRSWNSAVKSPFEVLARGGVDDTYIVASPS